MSQKSTEMEKSYITDFVHGGKVCCEKCGGFIYEGEEQILTGSIGEKFYWHKEPCFNIYEHYYGPYRPID